MSGNKILNKWKVAERRRALKKQAIEYMGGKCCKCGYNKCNSALAFHHLDPSKKDFGIGSKGCSRSWEKIKIELAKCILICQNCHAEIHEEKYNKTFKTLSEKEKQSIQVRESKKVTVKCAHCHSPIITYQSRVKRAENVFCGKECKYKFYESYKWPDDLELATLCSSHNITDVAKQLGLGKSSVYDRLNKIKTKHPELFKKKTKIEWPNKAKLEKMVWETPRSKLSETMGVSDKAIAKRCKMLGISMPPRGYWTKKYGA